MPNPDLSLLQIAAKAVEMGSMSAAAARLGISQSAVSQAVKRAEVQIGCALVERRKRPLVATAAGRALVLHIRAIALQTAIALEEIRSAGSVSFIRDLRIGMIDTFASTVGPLLIQALLRDAASSRVTTFSGLAAAQGDALLQNEIDVAVTTLPMDKQDGLLRFSLFREPYLLVSSIAIANEISGYPLSDILARHRFLAYSARSHMGTHIAQHLRRLRIEQPPQLSFDTSDALLAMVSEGVGVAITSPLCLIQRDARSSRLAVLPLPDPGLSREVTLIVRRGDGEQLGAHLANMIRTILARAIVPRIAAEIPWLAEQCDDMIL